MFARFLKQINIFAVKKVFYTFKGFGDLCLYGFY